LKAAKTFVKSFAAITCLLFSLQSIRSSAQTLQSPPPAQAAAAEIHPEKAIVYFYRPDRMFGMALHPSIYCDGIELQRLHNGTYFSAEVSAGKHMFTSGRSEVGQFMDLEPGKNYFFRFDLKKSSMFTRSQPAVLVQVSSETATPDMQKLKLADSH